ncbi:MAG: hypothetical protein GX971_13115 [Firmicutes bacterium]|mgnify:FL=1|nr:hypothetical protein [Bacillota bacterium]
MLKELLIAVGASDYLSKSVLASQLGQPISLIEDGLKQLVLLGYLAEDQEMVNCELPCGKCPYAAMCNQNPVRTMSITKKGERFLAHQRLN